MKELRNLLKQELLDNIREKVTPKAIKKKNANNCKLDSTIINQISYFRNLRKNHGSYVTKNQKALGGENEVHKGLVQIENRNSFNVVQELSYLNEDQVELVRVNKNQERQVNYDQEVLEFVCENQIEIERVNEDHEGFNHLNEKHAKNERNRKRNVKGQAIFNAKMNSQRYKNAMIREFERIVINNLNNVNNVNLNLENEVTTITEAFNNLKLENEEITITKAFNGTKKKDCSKWYFMLEFLKLTKNMSNEEVGRILNLKKDNIRKQMDTFKKVECYMSNLQRCNKNYHDLNLHFVYFQKILKADWDEVLIKINRVK